MNKQMGFTRNGRCLSVLCGLILVTGVAACAGSNSNNSQANGQASGKGSLTTVHLVNTKYGAELLPLTAGLARGVFKEHGINLEMTTANTSDIATSALISGRADLGLVQASYVVSADAAGANMTIIGNVLDQLDYHIITAKGITSLNQLAGKKMADPGPNNGNTAAMKAVMDKAGIGAAKLTYVTVGAQSSILAAIEANQAQVGLLVAPFTFEAAAHGLNDLGTIVKYLPNNTAAVIAGVSTALQQKPNTIRNFLAALYESSKWVKAHPTAAIAILQKADDMTPAVAKESYDAVDDFYSTNGVVSKSGLETWIQVALKYGVMNKPVSVSSVYTDKYLPNP